MLACSHLVIASENVEKIMQFFKQAFDLTPHFENKDFGEFVLPSGFRIAFFKPVGKSSKYFVSQSERTSHSFGITVKDVEAVYQKLNALSSSFALELSGPPKEHPWGEKSFLLIDPDQNRWEITESPTKEGMLVSFETQK